MLISLSHFWKVSHLGLTLYYDFWASFHDDCANFQKNLFFKILITYLILIAPSIPILQVQHLIDKLFHNSYCICATLIVYYQFSFWKNYCKNFSDCIGKLETIGNSSRMVCLQYIYLPTSQVGSGKPILMQRHTDRKAT